MTVEVAIDDIKIGKRHRQDHGDLAGLAASMKRLGMLQPVVLTPDRRLIAGERRLLAAGDLGWDKVPARIVDIENVLFGEHDENEIRKGFTVSERVAIGKEMEEALGNRSGQRTDKKFANGEPREKIPEVQPGERTSEVAAKKAGFGNRKTYEQAKKVVEQAAPAVVKAVDAGQVSISDAAKVADKPKAQQKAAVQAVKDGKAKTLHEAAAKPSPAEANGHAPAADETPLQDKAGVPVPTQARAAFALVGQMNALCRQIDALAREVKELAESPVGPHLMHETIVNALNTARKDLWARRPSHVCPYCEGKKTDCRACRGHGWLIETVYNAAPANLKG